jgi:hypothetical protein
MSDGGPTHGNHGESGDDIFTGQVESRLQLLRGRGCPDPDLIRASQFDSLPEELRSQVRHHVERCSICNQITRDLEDPEMLALSNEEEDRIRQRVFDSISRSTRPARQWRLWWLSIPVAASVLIVAALYWGKGAGSEPPGVARQEPTQPTPATPVPSVLTLTKPPMQIPAALLVFRSEGDPNNAALARAFNAYKSDNYEESAKLFGSLRPQLAGLPEVHFYHGVSLLFLSRHPEAVPALEAAKQAARGGFAREVTWYLALAHHLGENRDRATAELQELCRLPGSHQTEACAGIKELSDQRSR